MILKASLCSSSALGLVPCLHTAVLTHSFWTVQQVKVAESAALGEELGQKKKKKKEVSGMSNDQAMAWHRKQKALGNKVQGAD